MPLIKKQTMKRGGFKKKAGGTRRPLTPVRLKSKGGSRTSPKSPKSPKSSRTRGGSRVGKKVKGGSSCGKKHEKMLMKGGGDIISEDMVRAMFENDETLTDDIVLALQVVLGDLNGESRKNAIPILRNKIGSLPKDLEGAATDSLVDNPAKAMFLARSRVITQDDLGLTYAFTQIVPLYKKFLDLRTTGFLAEGQKIGMGDDGDNTELVKLLGLKNKDKTDKSNDAITTYKIIEEPDNSINNFATLCKSGCDKSAYEVKSNTITAIVQNMLTNKKEPEGTGEDQAVDPAGQTPTNTLGDPAGQIPLVDSAEEAAAAAEQEQLKKAINLEYTNIQSDIFSHEGKLKKDTGNLSEENQQKITELKNKLKQINIIKNKSEFIEKDKKDVKELSLEISNKINNLSE